MKKIFFAIASTLVPLLFFYYTYSKISTLEHVWILVLVVLDIAFAIFIGLNTFKAETKEKYLKILSWEIDYILLRIFLVFIFSWIFSDF